MRFLLIVPLILSTPALANCGDQISITKRVREMQRWVHQFSKIDNNESFDSKARLLEIGQAINAQARARIAETPAEEHERHTAHSDLVSLDGHMTLTLQEAFDFSAALTELNRSLRVADRPDLGAAPGIWIALVDLVFYPPPDLIQVRQIVDSPEYLDHFILDPLDKEASDLVLDTSTALLSETARLRSVFEKRYRYKPDVARRVTERLLAIDAEMPERIRHLNGVLADLWPRLPAEGPIVFPMIVETLDEVRAYFEIAVFWNRADGAVQDLE